jgi:hypothetical protein
MERMPLDAPTLIDFLRLRAEQVQEQRRRRAPTAAVKRGFPRQAAREPVRYPVLVAADKLYFRVSTGDPEVDTAAVEATFRRAFTGVWGRIPGPDRRCLVDYWRSDPTRLSRDPLRPTAHPRPCIRVVDAGPWSPSADLCGDLGAKLTFPFDLVAEHSHQLPLAIARALAIAHRYASRQHWALIEERLEKPMARWERRRGRKADADREAALDRLERAYLRGYQAEIAAILLGWGLDQAAG